MVIDNIEIRLCRNRGEGWAESEMRVGGRTNVDFLVITMRTDAGMEASSFGFAARGAEMSGYIAQAALKDFFLGRDPLAREKHWCEFRMHDRWLNHVPIYSYGPFDICLWDIAGKMAGLPLYRLLGEYRDKVPVYGSSLVLSTVTEYVRQAVEIKDQRWHAYKVHPPGRVDLDLEIYRACREAVGPDFPLMADPVAAYNHEQALRVGRELERLKYHWFEEPLFDVDFGGLRRLAASLDIPVCGTEVLAGNNYSIAECLATGVVDMVRADVSWKGGVTAVMKTAHLAESFGAQCEIHTSVYHAMDIVNLHCACAVSNCEFFELLYPMSHFDFGMKTPLHIDADGYAHPPRTAGIGVDFDWDYIDNCTVKRL
jgi:L-alanine-DL-glutamate epimerase-like enolase superfamily enzyme